MQKLLMVYLVSLLSLTACQSRDNTEIIDGFNNTLDKANEVIIDNNDAMYMKFNDKLVDMQFRAKAQMWNPRMVTVKTLSISIYKYLNGIKR